MPKIPKPPNIINPLWIIFLFFSFTEIALGYVVFNTEGYVQLSLTFFVIIFPLIIAIGFYFIVWFKPQNLYAPKDFKSDASFLKGISVQKKSIGVRYIDDDNINQILSILSSEGMVNDLNNALSGIVSYPELLLKNLPESNPFRKKILALQDQGRDAEARVQELLKIPINNPMSNEVAKGGIGNLSEETTDLENIEKEKKALEAQLHHARKMEAIGTLAGGVAHDLNNILSGIVSYPELLLLEIPEDSPLRKPLMAIKKSGEKAATIVQDLLTLARRGVATLKPVNLNEVIIEYLKSPEYIKMKSHSSEVKVEVINRFEPDLLNISGSHVHLSKTVMNIISNAIEAVQVSGRITISTKNRYIDKPIAGYDYIEEGDYVVFTVSDTGIGISPEDLERIFEPFYTKKVMGRSGTGLGMAVVWGTVKDHKGYIDVQSRVGKGTTITIFLPATEKEIVKDETVLSIDDYRGNGESILIVDDVEEQREIASTILSNLNYSVTTVSSGEEAVDIIKNTNFDLLVLDMIMNPGIDGLETYKRILTLHPKQKAIIVSGFSETDRIKEGQRLGAGEYVKKPFTLEKIGLAVKAELER